MTVHVQATEDAYESLDRQLGDLVDEMTHRRYYRFSRSVGWQPAVNVYENEHGFYLCAELAGLTKDQVEVEAAGNKIVLRGDRPVPEPPQSGGPSCILRMEINSGPFERTIELPAQADMTAVEAKLENGFLSITISKRNR